MINEHEKNINLCENCKTDIQKNNSLTCPTCKSRLPQNKNTCHRSSYYLAAATNYNDQKIRDLIWKLKYGKITAAAKPLSNLLSEHFNLLNLDIENPIVIPIPLHKNRKAERGFNQAELIATHFAKNQNLKISDGILMRTKYTPPQAETKTAKERHKNLENSFKIKNASVIENKTIILIDDVFTTGATAEAAISVIKEHNPKKVIVAVIAHA